MIGDDVVQKYGLSIVRTSATEPAYRLTSVEKLSGAENHGSSNIFVRVWNANGTRLDLPSLAIRSAVPGQPIQHYGLGKPDTNIERGHGDVPMSPKAVYTIAIVDGFGRQSDSITGMRSDLDDEEPGNSWGHHSFRLEFTLTGADAPPIVIPPDPPTDGGPDVAALRAWLAEGEAWLARGRGLVG